MGNITHDLMPIGRFAEASRLSIKALRLYDKVGLLPPIYVDHDSGYRFYSQDQLARAKLILLLRRIEMPLAMIPQVLETEEEEAIALLKTYWQGVEGKVAKGRKVVSYLYKLLQGEEERMTYDVHTKQVPKMKVVSICREVSIDELINYLQNSIQTLTESTTAQGGEVMGPPMGIYHGEVNEDSDGPVEVCLPVKGDVEPSGEIVTRELATSQVAYTNVTLDQAEFPQILQAYDAVYKWIQRNGHEITDSPREIYLRSSKGIDPDEAYIEIGWPYD